MLFSGLRGLLCVWWVLEVCVLVSVLGLCIIIVFSVVGVLGVL